MPHNVLLICLGCPAFVAGLCGGVCLRVCGEEGMATFSLVFLLRICPDWNYPYQHSHDGDDEDDSKHLQGALCGTSTFPSLSQLLIH